VDDCPIPFDLATRYQCPLIDEIAFPLVNRAAPPIEREFIIIPLNYQWRMQGWFAPTVKGDSVEIGRQGPRFDW
jgi:hypothetical protein